MFQHLQIQHKQLKERRIQQQISICIFIFLELYIKIIENGGIFIVIVFNVNFEI